MPKIQQTFTVIDPTISMQNLRQRRPDETLPELAPAMTSKQAQKRWREMNKQPRTSKEEERRIEREEQARIKAEFEKEKATKRARVLREKKKEKEQKILEEKRKKGLPLVDVHPSQSTISWFVRQDTSTKRKHENLVEPEDDQHPSRPHPTQRIHQQETRQNQQPASPKLSSPPITLAADQVFHPNTTTTMVLRPSSQPGPLRDITNYCTPSHSANMQFQFDDLEDLFPTSSQMDRELQEEYSTPPAKSTAKQSLPAPKPSRPPVPLFDDNSKFKTNDFTPRVPTPLAPLPAQNSPSKVVDHTKNVIDYFSSQDWNLSSQDIRELEGGTASSAKPAETCSFQSRRQSSIALRPSPRKTQQSSAQPQPSLPRLPLSPVAHGPSSAKQPVPQSSEPPRFFGSSGDGVELLMGLWESRKLAEQEELKRKEAERKRLAEEKLHRERLQKELEDLADELLLPLSQCSMDHHTTQEPVNATPGGLQSALGTNGLTTTNTAAAASAAKPESDYGGTEFKEPSDVTLALLDPIAAPQPDSDYGGSEFKGLGDETLSLMDPVAAPQDESDYGDSEFKGLEEEALSRLEAAATTAASISAIPNITVTTAPDSGTAGDATGQSNNTVLDPNVSFGIGDGSWMSDDDELDI